MIVLGSTEERYFIRYYSGAEWMGM